jgi:hypothetical protein
MGVWQLTIDGRALAMDPAWGAEFGCRCKPRDTTLKMKNAPHLQNQRCGYFRLSRPVGVQTVV